MPFRPARSARAVAVGTAIAMAAGLSATTGGAATPAADVGPPADASPATVAASHNITLITGDTATLDIGEDGIERASLAPGTGPSEGYHAFFRGQNAYLVPSAAQPLLASDRLDLELFNLSALVEQGLDDPSSPTLPLIISAGDAQRRAPQSLAGSTTDTVLESIGAVAVNVTKTQSTSFWQDATADAEPALLSTGLDKIWLDAKVEGQLDESAAQIGAPAAWDRGLTGAGSTIAVLDSGIDTAHPDVRGRVGDSEDFTGSGTADDRFGHGTHVASIAAGSGAGSDGLYRGIAPEATLLVGKVLGDDGTGSTSAAIEGMEWAASQGADVVNLSLGGPITRGDDPMSQAVNRLTEEQDVLFVVSAGNYSPWVPGMAFVTSPAAADAALAVGGLQRPDSLWTGSRRGRMDGAAIKPEIVAPGFNITAAGSSGAGLPPYISQTSTSMAAPHVAGVAALLKQQHPEWGAAQLHAVLTSTATPLDPYLTSYEQGAGRVDTDRATSQQVFTDTGILQLGHFTRPFDDDELTVTRTLTYRNESAAPVTLDLTTSLTSRGEDVPAGTLTVAPPTLQLAPGESGRATVALDATGVPAGSYSGHVTASSAGLRIGTTVGFDKQDDTVDVTLRAIGRDGEPGTATVRITPYREHDARYYPDYIYLSPDQPEYTVRLPEGDYNLWSLVTTFDASGRYTEEESIVGDPKLSVRPRYASQPRAQVNSAPNFEVTIDARDAVPVTVDTPRPSAPRSMTTSWWRGEPGTTLFAADTWYWSFNDGEPEKVSITPTERVDDAPFGVTTSFDTGVTPLDARVGGRRLDAVQVAGPPVDGRRRLPVVDIGDATEPLPDLAGAVALVQESEVLSHSEQVEAAAAAGAAVVALSSAQPGVFWPEYVSGPVPVIALSRADGEILAARAGSATLDLVGTPRTPYAYDVTFTEEARVPSRLDYRVLPRDLAQVTTSIYTTGTDERGWRLHQSTDAGCGCSAPAVDDFVPATGYVRTEYVTARPGLDTISAWQFVFGRPADVLYSRAGQVYERGENISESWLEAPFSPGVPQSDIRAGGRSPVSRRTGDSLYYSLAAVTDAAGHWAPTFSPTTSASRLYRDGEQIYANQWSLSGSVPVPAEPGTYRLEADVDHDASWLGLSTRTHTAWTFESAGGSGSTVLPLIDADYTGLVDVATGRAALDLANTAVGEREVRLDLVAAHQNGSDAPPVEHMTVRVSYDDGVSWQDAEVTADGEVFAAAYRHPAVADTNGYVSLQVTASDGAGGALDQTLIRAYRIGDS